MNMMKRILKVRYCSALLLGGFALLLPMEGKAQEFRATVEVNSQQLEGTNKSVFETLQEAMNTYMNETKFSEATFGPQEKIECRIFFTVSEYDGDRMKGDLQLQLSRPVYNSTYTTTLFNFRDSKVEFEYREGDPLIYNRTMAENNLTAILDFYAYLFLGIDFDSFSPRGGDLFYEQAQSIVQQQQSSGEVGWRTFEDTKNRAAVLGSYTDSSTSGIRDLLYRYHRRGLDEMVTSPDKGRATITESLEEIKKVGQNAPMSVALSIFRDAKLDELVNIYSKGTDAERNAAYDILQPLFPTESSRLEKIRKPE